MGRFGFRHLPERFCGGWVFDFVEPANQHCQQKPPSQLFY
nr:MAG TPA: hypothetical protein [Caudoviricetes sp.]